MAVLTNANAPFYYENGCILSYEDPKTVSVSPGRLRNRSTNEDSDNQFDIFVEETLTVSFDNLSSFGLGRVDRKIDNYLGFGWYAIYVVAGSVRGSKAYAVAVPYFAPFYTFEPGVPEPAPIYDPVSRTSYNIYRHVGWVYDQSTQVGATGVSITPFKQTTLGQNYRRTWWDVARGSLIVTNIPDVNIFVFTKVNGALNSAICPNADQCQYRFLANANSSAGSSFGYIASDQDPGGAADSLDNYPITVYNAVSGTSGNTTEIGSLQTFFQYPDATDPLGAFGIGYKRVDFQGNGGIYVVSSDYEI